MDSGQSNVEIPKSEEELNSLLEELEDLHKFALQKYIPHKKQKDFHMAPHKIRAIFGGNRSGKTESGTNEAKFHATGDYPDWYPEKGRFSGATRGRIVVTDYKKGCQEVLEPKITQWFPEERIVRIERFMGHITKLFIRHRTGGVSTIDIMTHEQDNRSFEGWSGHWVWFDEPPPRDQYVACLRGLIDFDGRCWLTLTPISESWLYDEIVLTATPNRVWFNTVDIRDNPYLSEASIRDFEASLTPEEIDARIHGKFIHLAGRIYKMLNPEIHVIKEIPSKDWKYWPKWFVLDPADRRPHHGIWATVDPMNTVYIYDEIVFKGTIKDTSKQILLRERSAGLVSDEIIRVLDPNKGRTPSAATGLKLVEEFAINDVYFTCNVNDDIATGHLAVMQALSYDKDQPLSSTNSPKLYFIRDTTPECVKQMLMYSWDDWRDKSSKSEKEKPKDIMKDFPDDIRYLIMSNPIFYQPEKSTSFSIGNPYTGYAL